MANKVNTPDWLKSKKFLFIFALVATAAVVAGYNSFAHSRPSISTPCLGGVIKEGSKGSCVLAAQKSLNYLCKNTPYVPEDSVWASGDAMTKRTKGFQNVMQTSTDGIIGPTTWGGIYDRVWGSKKVPYAHTLNCTY